MSARPDTWLCLADAREARLLRGAAAPDGNVHFETRAATSEAWEPAEHHRPSPRSGKDGHGYASEGHEDDERRRRHGREVAAWLEGALEADGIEHVAVVAPARILGALRPALSDRLSRRVELHEGDLLHVPDGRLPSHPLVAALLGLEAPEELARG